jgi:hypothetical protein
MSRFEREFETMFDAVFTAYNIKTWRLDRRKKHPVVVFVIGKEERFFTYAGTASDFRSVLNHKRDLKRMLHTLGLEPRKC